MAGIVFKVGFPDQKGRFRKLETAVKYAVVGGLNDGGRKVFTKIRQHLREQTKPKRYATVTSRTGSRAAVMGAARFEMFAKNEAIDLAEFGARLTGRGVEAAPWGQSRVFQRSFQDRKKVSERNMEGFVARLGGKRYPIRALHGPNLAREFMGLTRGSRIPQVFATYAQIEVPKAILARLDKALGSS